MQKCRQIFCGSIGGLTAVLILIAAGAGMIFFAQSMSGKGIGDTASISICLAAVLCAVLLCIFFIFACKRIDKIREATLLRLPFFLFSVYLVGMIVVLVSFNVFPPDGSVAIADRALAIALDGSQSGVVPVEGDALLTWILALFYRFLSGTGIVNFNYASILLNAAMLLIAEVLCYLGVKKLFSARMACKYLLLSVCNPVSYMTIPWVDSVSFCMPLMGGVFYLGACIYKQKNTYLCIAQSAGVGILAAISCFIRPVVFILVFAYAVCLLFWLAKEKKKILKAAVVCVCCFLLTAGTFFGVLAVMPKSDSDGLDGVPASTVESTDDAEQADVSKKTVGWLLEKHARTWGTMDSGVLEKLQQDQRYTFVYNVTVGDENIAFLAYCTAYRLAVFMLAVLSLVFWILKKNRPGVLLMPLLTLFGGMLFYLFGPAGAADSIPFLFFIVLLATHGGCVAANRWSGRRCCKVVLPVCACATVVLAAVNVYPLALQKRESRRFSVQCTNMSNITAVQDILENNDILLQDFFTANAFDTVALYCTRLSGDAVYEIAILDQNNQIQAFGQFSKADLNGSLFTFHFSEIDPSVRQRYTVRIQPVKGQTDSVAFDTYRYQRASGYDGQMKIGGKTVAGDLRMQVYHTYSGVQMQLPLYLILTVFLLGAQVVFLILVSRKKSQKNSC